MNKPTTSLWTIVGTSALLLSSWLGCTAERADVGSRSAGGTVAPEFAADDASSGADARTMAGTCPTNECPEGRATCPNEPFPCAVSLASDPDNCGECGRHCPAVPELGLVSECVKGVCEFACENGRADCNGFADDGCEVIINGSDTKNCGACGSVCSTMCFLGTCGCSGGKTLCTNGCIDTRTDEANCGACGNVCNEPRPAFPQDWHAKYGCVDGACYVPICRPGWFDCNGDFLDPGGDGCEINGDEDTANCGGCGLACGVGEVCDYGRCKCACGTGCSFPLEADVDNCGACGFRCPGARSPLPQMSEPFVDISHGGPICDRGLCDYRCSEGWADCDGDIQNGCETRLLDDPRHCGTCGVRCDGVEGQACVEGVCTTKGCTVQ